MQFGRNTDARTAWTSIVGFACNQGFVFSLFYLGSDRGLGDGVHVFERAELFGTLLFMTAAFVLLRLVAPRARDALLALSLIHISMLHAALQKRLARFGMPASRRAGRVLCVRIQIP